MRESESIRLQLADRGRTSIRATGLLGPWVLCAGLIVATTVRAAPEPAASALVPPAADLRMRALAATCAACHGTDGRSTADDALPRLAGRPAEELAQTMRAFKSGARPGTVMPQLAKGYDDAQIDLLACYFAAQSAAPATKATKAANAMNAADAANAAHAAKRGQP
ncbi:cytochrome c553 [Roseateles depolymerans]|uniref:Cytochrome C553 n=2 Tax=Roseateles depolymerans TaxID=76731 RepID=A0A0U3MNC6_9BURK|nr:cytochrome C553 [Roseateles depolymerans]REG10071.1 cytochrome c553 [Roseateles depolymerans]